MGLIQPLLTAVYFNCSPWNLVYFLGLLLKVQFRFTAHKIAWILGLQRTVNACSKAANSEKWDLIHFSTWIQSLEAFILLLDWLTYRFICNRSNLVQQAIDWIMLPESKIPVEQLSFYLLTAGKLFRTWMFEYQNYSLDFRPRINSYEIHFIYAALPPLSLKSSLPTLIFTFIGSDHISFQLLI